MSRLIHSSLGQAVKYLERMLIQANSQAERSAEDLDSDEKLPRFPPSTSGSSHLSGEDVEMQSIEEQRNKNNPYDNITIKEEMITDDCPPTASSTPVKTSDEFKIPNKDPTESTQKMDVDEGMDNPPEQQHQTETVNSKDINIDPRTYCKLGHFHLLLEEYPKGIHICFVVA